MEVLKKFQSSTFDTTARRRLVEDQDTILELTGKIQDLQTEINCVNDSKILKMLNQFAVYNPTLPVNLRFSHLIEILAECWAVLWECRAATIGRQVFGTRMVYRETFLQIQRRLLQHLIRQSRIHGSLLYQNTHHHMWWVKAKHQLWIRDASQDRQPEIHSSLVREDFQIIMEQTNLNYADLFTIGLRNDDIQEFDSKWDGILLSMTKIPLDDILEGLYKLRIRESEKLKTVLELYDIITDWKRWWKEVSSRTYEIWILAPEMEIKKETPWSRIREQNSVYREFLEIVGNGSPTGSVLEETIAVSDTIRISVEKRHSQIRLRILSCSRMREMRREPKVREAKKSEW